MLLIENRELEIRLLLKKRHVKKKKIKTKYAHTHCNRSQIISVRKIQNGRKKSYSFQT